MPDKRKIEESKQDASDKEQYTKEAKRLQTKSSYLRDHVEKAEKELLESKQEINIEETDDSEKDLSLNSNLVAVSSEKNQFNQPTRNFSSFFTADTTNINNTKETESLSTDSANSLASTLPRTPENSETESDSDHITKITPGSPSI